MFAISQTPPCDTAIDNADVFCSMMWSGWFCSKDQITGLLWGLSFVAKYIPASAAITTCSGEVFHPYEMAGNIADGIVRHIGSNVGRNITIPGSKQCCGKYVKLSNVEGGDCTELYAGFVKVRNFINPESAKGPGFFDKVIYQKGAGGIGQKFYLQMEAASGDIDDRNSVARGKFLQFLANRNKEIYALGNDLLFPDGPGIADEFGEDFFLDILCSAPCSGICTKPKNYPTDPLSPPFNCANTPNWLGERWEGDKTDEEITGEAGIGGDPRLFNGFDYMALYNMFMLRFEPGTKFYNPDSFQPSYSIPEPDNSGTMINGPGYLPLGQSDDYSFTMPPNGSIAILNQFSTWTPTANISIDNPEANIITASMNSFASPSGLHVEIRQGRTIAQFFDGVNVTQFPPNGQFAPPVPEGCLLSLDKPINTDKPYVIDSDFNWCEGVGYYANLIANVPLPPGATFVWTFLNQMTGESLSMTGNNLVFDFPGNGSTLSSTTIRVVVSDALGNVITTVEIHKFLVRCDDPTMLIAPNPGRTNIDVTIPASQPIPTNGLDVFITRLTPRQTMLTRKMYFNSINIDISGLPVGSYRVAVSGPTFNAQQDLIIIQD